MEFINNDPRPKDMRESNDCTVRATSIALGKSYKDIHEAYAKHGRKPRKGVTVMTLHAVLMDLVGDNLKIVASDIVRPERKSLAKFIKDNPKGKYVIVRRGHAFAVIDGVAHDAHPSGCSPRCIVKFAYKVGE